MGMGSSSTRQRPWVRWVGLAIFVVVLGFVFVRLGEWQLDRLEQRKANNAVIQRHESSPVIDYSEVFDKPITDLDQWQRVRITGTFDTEHQFQVRFRNNDGPRGIEVVTPLRTSSGDVVLVDRGFIETNTSEVATIPAAPTGTVTVVGYVRRNEQGSSEAITPVDGMMRLINAPAIEKVLGYPVADGYIGLLEITPAQEGDFTPVEPPALNEGPHFWYAVQWFMFAGIAGLGLFVFIRNDIRGLRGLRRKRRPRGRGQPTDDPAATAGPDADNVTASAAPPATHP